MLYNQLPYKSGDIYNNLILTGKSFINKGHTMVEYICVCGKLTYTRLSSLISTNTKSCGCLKGILVANSQTKHGIHDHPLYDIWHGLKQRCYNKNKREYPDYGGRGILMCNEWLKNPKSFYDWAISKGWVNGLTVERANNYGHYSPDNCTLATMYEQSRNRRGNVILTAFGETKIATDWAKDERCKIGVDGLWYRIRNGWEAEAAISTLSINITRTKKYKLNNN